MARYEEFHVAGISYRIDEVIDKLSYENDDFNLSKSALAEEYTEGEKVYALSWETRNPELIPEPDNPHDPNALRVEVNGVHIGYIKKSDCTHVKNLLLSPNFSNISIEIGGGEYKQFYYEDYELNPVIESGEDVYYAVVNVFLRDDETPAVSKDPTPPAPASKPKSNAGGVVLGILGGLFAMGGLGNIAGGSPGGIVGCIIGVVLIYFCIRLCGGNNGKR